MRRSVRSVLLLATLTGGCAIVAGLDDDPFLTTGDSGIAADASPTPTFAFDIEVSEVWRSDAPLRIVAHATRSNRDGAVAVALTSAPPGVSSAGTSIAGDDAVSFDVTAAARLPQGTIALTFTATAAGLPTLTKSVSLYVAGAPGELDTSFGNGGVTTLPGLGSLHTVTIRPDGALVAFGDDVIESTTDAGVVARRQAFGVRLAASGLRDESFALGTGLVRDGSGTAEDTSVRGAVADGERMIFAGSSVRAGDTRRAAWLGSVFNDGGLDPSFGDGGYTLLTRPTDDAGGVSVKAIESLVAYEDAGAVGLDGSTPRFATVGTDDGRSLVRYFTARGSPTELPGQSAYDGGLFAVHQVDTRFLVAGNAPTGASAAIADLAKDIQAITIVPQTFGTVFGIAACDGGYLLVGIQGVPPPALGTEALAVRVSSSFVVTTKTALSSLRMAKAVRRIDDGALVVTGVTADGSPGYVIVPRSGDPNAASKPIALDRARFGLSDPLGAWEAAAPFANGRIVLVGESAPLRYLADYTGTRIVARYWN